MLCVFNDCLDEGDTGEHDGDVDLDRAHKTGFGGGERDVF